MDPDRVVIRGLTHKVVAVNQLGTHSVCGALASPGMTRGNVMRIELNGWPPDCATCYPPPPPRPTPATLFPPSVNGRLHPAARNSTRKV